MRFFGERVKAEHSRLEGFRAVNHGPRVYDFRKNKPVLDSQVTEHAFPEGQNPEKPFASSGSS